MGTDGESSATGHPLVMLCQHLAYNKGFFTSHKDAGKHDCEPPRAKKKISTEFHGIISAMHLV